jgi:exoribonuclease R
LSPSARAQLPLDDAVVEQGLAAILDELDVPRGFPPEAEQAAAEAHDRAEGRRADRRDLELVAIDPAGSTDLDQALRIEPGPDGGHVVWYAIADVAAFVVPGDPVDAEAWRRGVTLYAPGQRSPLHPPALSEDAASLRAGHDRPAVLWRLQLDPEGALVDTTVGRALVRVREELAYGRAQERIDAGDRLLEPLRTVGRQRLQAEADRGGASLPVPEQEVRHDDRGYRLEYRAPLPVEAWNAQLSLLCGMAAAELMLAGGWGLLRTLPPAPADSLATLRRTAVALDIAWAAEEAYADVVRRLDPAVPTHAAFLVQATRLFRGAGLLPLRPGGSGPGDLLVHAAIAAPYAHVTAPLRRLGDRYATEAVLATVAGEEPPAWVREGLEGAPEAVGAGNRRAGDLERAVVDHVEALVLSHRVGDVFDAVVVDHRKDGSVLQFVEPAVVVDAPGEQAPLGDAVRARVVSADPIARRTVVELL